MTDRDKKTIKGEIISRIFSAITYVLMTFLIAFLIAVFQDKFGLLFLGLSALSVITGVLLFIYTSRKLRSDLKDGKVTLIRKVLKDKNYRIDYEPGSATMPVTILSFLTPSIFSRKMKQVDIYTAWTEEEKYDITKEDFDKIEIGDEIIIKRAYNSDIFLGIENNYA
jgi:hypothetical protein